MSAAELEAMFRERGTMRGGVLLLRADDALSLVEMARQQKVKVLGADAFLLRDGATLPLMEHSLDLGTERTTGDRDIWGRLSDHIRQLRSSDLYFEIVMG